MTEPVHSSEERLQARIAIMEDLLRQVVEIDTTAVSRMQALDEKLRKFEAILPTLSGLVKKLDAVSTASSQPPSASGKEIGDIRHQLDLLLEKVVETQGTRKDITDIGSHLDTLHRELTSVPQRLETILEKVMTAAPSADVPVLDQLNQLAGFPEMVGRLESQQSTILQTLEKRVDPRLMIYLKPLIEMLEEEGRQAEQLKNAALRQLQDLVSGTSPGSDQEISQVLQQVDQEIRRCTEAFERTQQALQIVVTPFQNVGRLFRNNLEIVVQAHDLMAQLHGDLPRFLSEMRARHEESQRMTTPS
ncbi:conserved hypothetical protein [Gammaproteobacteria bacterium]